VFSFDATFALNIETKTFLGKGACSFFSLFYEIKIQITAAPTPKPSTEWKV
jgi:hypothetical protein